MLLVLTEKKQKVKSIEFENSMRVAHVYAREVSRGNEKSHGVEFYLFRDNNVIAGCTRSRCKKCLSGFFVSLTYNFSYDC